MELEMIMFSETSQAYKGRSACSLFHGDSRFKYVCIHACLYQLVHCRYIAQEFL